MSQSDVCLEIPVGNPTQAEPQESRLEIQETIEVCTGFLVAMRASNPEVLRGIRVHRTLHRMPCHLLGKDLVSLYDCSEATDQFDEFWSHSWQAPLWMKYVNVLFLNNVVPACVVSILSACVAIGLVLGGFLPNSDSRWCMWFGATGYLFTFIVWHCRKLVFLDISCIKQADSIQKTDAIISMGAFLKNSKSMLVFWDSTYVTRLWCVFELSGFLHSRKPNSTTELAVCPLPLGVAFVLGHVSLTLFLFVLMTLEDAMDDAWVHILVVLVLGICCFTALAAACREYFRNVQEMQRQLTSFTCAQAKSQCCQKGHEGARAGSLCDREIILHCIIASW